MMNVRIWNEKFNNSKKAAVSKHVHLYEKWLANSKKLHQILNMFMNFQKFTYLENVQGFLNNF